jgi:signal peptidase I
MPRLHLVKFLISTLLVEGDSMSPTYSSGDWLLARWGSFNRSRLKIGQVVVIELDHQPGIYYVKRITDVNHEMNEIFVSSDNPAGTDSRTWGYLPSSCVRARVLIRIRKSK